MSKYAYRPMSAGFTVVPNTQNRALLVAMRQTMEIVASNLMNSGWPRFTLHDRLRRSDWYARYIRERAKARRMRGG